MLPRWPLNQSSADFWTGVDHLGRVNTSDARGLAVRVLQRREKANDYTEDLLAQELAARELAPSDRGLAHELVYGVVRWQATLDWLISRKTQGRAQTGVTRILLRLGLYQLFWLQRIPDHAAVNESVVLAKRLGVPSKAGFVNAVLRGYLRERDETQRALEELKRDQPALGYSHPEWLFSRWESRWGRAQAIELMGWNNQPSKTFARVNTVRIQPEALQQAWASEGVSASPVQRAWLAPDLVYELVDHPRLSQLPSFQQGWFYIQDPSTILAVRQLQPQPGEEVLDLCAAPGGKATYIAQLMQNRGRLVAQDLDPQRLRIIRENCQRLGVSCEVGLPLAANQAAEGFFDRVLVDAPCSNTGVMRRRVDLRWRIRPEEITRLQRAQVDLLWKAAPQVKPGGILVYSTCSLEPEENRDVITRFLQSAPAYRLEQEHQLLPFVDSVDGAYVARLLRTAAS